MTAHVLTLSELLSHSWASCGPAALSALLGVSLTELRAAFPAHSARRTWTNLAQMRRALDVFGYRNGLTEADPDTVAPVGPNGTRSGLANKWPRRGLVLIQFRGTWEQGHVPLGASLARSHWIAVKPFGGHVVFDINGVGEEPGAAAWWNTRGHWERVIAPEIARSYGRSSLGAWWARAGLEVWE